MLLYRDVQPYHPHPSSTVTLRARTSLLKLLPNPFVPRPASLPDGLKTDGYNGRSTPLSHPLPPRPEKSARRPSPTPSSKSVSVTTADKMHVGKAQTLISIPANHDLLHSDREVPKAQIGMGNLHTPTPSHTSVVPTGPPLPLKRFRGGPRLRGYPSSWGGRVVTIDSSADEIPQPKTIAPRPTRRSSLAPYQVHPMSVTQYKPMLDRRRRSSLSSKDDIFDARDLLVRGRFVMREAAEGQQKPVYMTRERRVSLSSAPPLPKRKDSKQEPADGVEVAAMNK